MCMEGIRSLLGTPRFKGEGDLATPLQRRAIALWGRCIRDMTTDSPGSSSGKTYRNKHLPKAGFPRIWKLLILDYFHKGLCAIQPNPRTRFLMQRRSSHH